MSRENIQNWADLPSGCFLVLVSGSIPTGRPSNNRIPQSSFSIYKSVEKNIFCTLKSEHILTSISTASYNLLLVPPMKGKLKALL